MLPIVWREWKVTKNLRECKAEFNVFRHNYLKYNTMMTAKRALFRKFVFLPAVHNTSCAILKTKGGFITIRFSIILGLPTSLYLRPVADLMPTRAASYHTCSVSVFQLPTFSKHNTKYGGLLKSQSRNIHCVARKTGLWRRQWLGKR